MSEEKFPEEIIVLVKKCILDYLGVTLAGALLLQEKGNNFLQLFDSEQGNTKVIGFNKKSSLQNAAFINGFSAHVLEFDDGVRFGGMHLGAPIISAIFPLIANKKISVPDLIKGIIIGYEVAIRISSTIQPSHKQKGFHTTGTCGTIGAALGVAAALGFSKSQMKNTFSSALASASGMLNVYKDDSELKPFNSGLAALNGLNAAYISKAGFNGPLDILSGDKGFLSMMAEKTDKSKLERKSRNSYAIELIYMKPYAACRHAHSAIEATINLRSTHNIRLEEIQRINVKTYEYAIRDHAHTDIQGASSAKLSIPYSVAIALIKGKVGIAEFLPDHIKNPLFLALTKKVHVSADNDLTALTPEKRPAIVEIVLANNLILRNRVDLAKGEPEKPLSVEELNEKFISLAKYCHKSEEDANVMIQCVWNLERDYFKLLELL